MRASNLILPIALLLAASTTARAYPLWCEDADALEASVDPQTAAVLLTHAGAMYNCCPEPILYDVEASGGTLTVVERVVAETPCDCICCFDLDIVVTDVPPGDWAVVLRWLDEESGSWRELTGSVTVPAPARDVAPHAELAAPPACLTSTGVEPATPSGAWGLVKAIYR
ncbi:MAG: hypothetical protein Q7W56_03180 [Candidatus Latescibacteria bacterium]|nr:hypothetical protein [Candidatus Latescibacterota bacterium]